MSVEGLLCITHDIKGIASCMQRDTHLADCEREGCKGCVPRMAETGWLCGSCWHRLEKAISVWDYEFFPTFAGEIRAVQPEPSGGGGKPGSTVPMSALQLAMDEIIRYRRSQRKKTAVIWVSSWRAHAEDAVRFTRAVEQAVRAFPRKEGVKKIPTTRCPNCGLRTLVYSPAPAVGKDAVVKCMNHDCGNVMDHTSFERIALVEAQCCRRCRSNDGCTDHECTCHRLAPVPEWQRTNKPSEEQQFDPNRFGHSDLDILTTHPLAELRRIAGDLGVPRFKQLRKHELVAAIRATDNPVETS